MIRAIYLSLILFVLPGCDCQKGQTESTATFAYLVAHHGLCDLDEISWKRFEAALRRQSFWALGRTLEPLDKFYDEPGKITGPIKKAADLVIAEILSQNPDWRDVHRFLGDDYFGGPKSELLFPAIAKCHPEMGWQLLNDYYRAAYQSNPDMGMSSEHAWLFFGSLQRHHPNLAWNYLKELLIEFSYESSALRIGGAGGMMSAMTTPEEALSFLSALRKENLGDRFVGLFGLRRDYLQISPNETELQRIETNALLTLSRVSPADAEEWILENRKTGRLPKRWAQAYLIGCARSDQDGLDSSFSFVDRHQQPDDPPLIPFSDDFTLVVTLEDLKVILIELNKESSP